MTNTPAQNKQTAQYRRGETVYNWLGDLVDEFQRGETPEGWLDEWFERFRDFVEDEVRRAYGRGFHDCERRQQGGRRASQQRYQESRRPGQYHSAVQNGKLRPVHREGA